ncbi:helix-turn-helix domain-containing protein [Actinokineospora globicatena]|uniref:helix-turn-helix domain-containing protein n=1 Tax=Actinokineospora globicatena TaxID=103729 RepID=UPI0020A5E8C0|nr:helix-turn-helix domain-containing protein [Actinokineospora globicatena]MCP2302514.1 DNA binding domain-containing protein, excisionase family [Actinokineospora globicatena]GLW75801.1 hypothetical protein Aglo01_02830 [Actinokineospora globicatena]GLW82639.1 hypothetical protein Aglo02_02800 [Actinokineospora globicatena]
MSALVSTNERDVLLANEDDQRAARALIGRLSEVPQFTAEPAAADPDGQVRVPRALSALIAHVVRAVAQGHTITVSSMPEELTTTTAANLLGISRPTLMRKIAAGDIPAHKVGSHTRLLTADVLAEREARRQRQIQALADLRELEDEG